MGFWILLVPQFKVETGVALPELRKCLLTSFGIRIVFEYVNELYDVFFLVTLVRVYLVLLPFEEVNVDFLFVGNL